MSPADLVEHHAVRVLLQLRALHRFNFGQSLLTDEVRESLLRLDGFQVYRNAQMREPFEFGWHRGRRVIWIRSDLPKHAVDFGCVHLLASRQAGSVPHGLDVADVVAIVVLFPEAPDCEDLAAQALEELRLLDEDWYESHLATLLPIVSRVRSSLEAHGASSGDEWLLDLAAERITGKRAHEEARRERDRGDLDEAEHWYARAATLSVTGQDWATALDSLLALGTLCQRRNDLAAAEGWFSDALILAYAHGTNEDRGKAHHDLLGLAARRADSLLLRKHARNALECYGPANPAIRAVASDTALFWLNGMQFEEALVVFDALVRCVPAGQVSGAAIQANRAICLGAMANYPAYADAWDCAWRMGRDLPGEMELSIVQGLAEAAANIQDHLRHDLAVVRWRELVVRTGAIADERAIHATHPALCGPCSQVVGLPNADTSFAHEIAEMLTAPARITH